MPEREK